MCVTSLLGGPWADLWPFYGLYSKPCKPLNNWENRLQYNPWKGHKSTHGQRISCFLLKSFHFRRLRKLQVFFSMQILIFRMLCNNVDVRQCLYFELGRPVVYQETWTIPRYSDFRLFDHVRGFVRLFSRYACFGRFGHFACFGRFVSVVSFRCFRF